MSVTAPPAEALQLNESISLALEEGQSTIFDSDGCVPIHIIRPGVGRGRGKHLYEAAMLQRNAGQFAGWRMYVDHQSLEARRAAGGLPRSVRDLGGRILESHWDPTVPADPSRGYGQGAVVGRAKPVPFVRDLIENDPGLIEASISASATGVKPVNHPGHGRVWMVEGIADRGSVDWVTEAGAGGRVAPLLESSYDTEEAVEMALMESMTDEEFASYVAEQRPGLKIEGVPATPTKPNTLIESEEDDDMAKLTPEQLREALAEHPEVLAEAVSGIVDQRVQAGIARERELQESESTAQMQRVLELRDMRDDARDLIEATALPDSWKEGLMARFTLNEAHVPSAELDLVDEMDASGTITKSARTRLRESVHSAIETEQRKLAEVRPTRVRGQGARKLQEGEAPESGDTTTTSAATTRATEEVPLWKQVLQEANVDTDKAYAA